MQLQKMNNQMPVTAKQTSFSGTFHVNDPKVLSLSKEFSEDMYLKVARITGKYYREVDSDVITIKAPPENDISVFAQLKELGVKFKAMINAD